jgi:hypothetical protein
MVYTILFSSSNCSLFHNSNVFGSCIIHILYIGVLKLKKNNSGTKMLISVEMHILLLTIPLLLTHSMVQSPSWEGNWFAARQEIPRISRNPKVHYRTHKRQPPVSILGQPNPGHIPTSHLLGSHPNIIHPSTPRSPQWQYHCHLFLIFIALSTVFYYTTRFLL